MDESDSDSEANRFNRILIYISHRNLLRRINWIGQK